MGQFYSCAYDKALAITVMFISLCCWCISYFDVILSVVIQLCFSTANGGFPIVHKHVVRFIGEAGWFLRYLVIRLHQLAHCRASPKLVLLGTVVRNGIWLRIDANSIMWIPIYCGMAVETERVKSENETVCFFI